MKREGEGALSDLHETDFYAWTQAQAGRLRMLARGEMVNDLDAPNLAEEIESVGHSLQDQLTSRLGVLLAHLLKWQYQSDRRSNSWRLTIVEQRRRVTRLLDKNPSLKHDLAGTFSDAYGDAILIAARETDMSENTFPSACPWPFEAVVQDDFWPAA